MDLEYINKNIMNIIRYVVVVGVIFIAVSCGKKGPLKLKKEQLDKVSTTQSVVSSKKK